MYNNTERYARQWLKSTLWIASKFYISNLYIFYKTGYLTDYSLRVFFIFAILILIFLYYFKALERLLYYHEPEKECNI